LDSGDLDRLSTQALRGEEAGESALDDRDRRCTGLVGIAEDLLHLPAALRKSLTWDRGREMAEPQQLAAHLRYCS
jgi:IS30 family transposase